MAREGWLVVASARRANLLADLASAAEAAGGSGKIQPLPLDVTDAAAVKSAVQMIEEKYGTISCAILNAGTYVPDQLETVTAQQIADHYQLNVMGTMNCMLPLVPVMRGRAGAQIAIVSSVAGFRGLPLSIAYGSSKAALINMTEAMKFDCDRLGIKLQLINPGFVKTPLTDKNTFAMPFLLDVDNAAQRIARGLASRRFEITFPWRFVVWLKLLRLLPYAVYFPLVKAGTKNIK
jgi:NAD(P)-dependent dehydrogenase (short-subunit alcohol dehydrogenase family)